MKRLVIFIALLLLISNVTALYFVGNNSQISNIYGPNENIRGWLNMSLANEPVSSLFEDSLDNSINLLNLLKSDSLLVPGTDYSCMPSDCGINYEASGGEISKDIELDSRDEVIIGFEFTEEIQEIKFVNFDIVSDAGPSCTNQLELDFLSDGTIELGNNKSHPDICGGLVDNDGCFEEQTSYSPYIISHGPGNKHCQRIRLTKSPGFRLGATIIPQGEPLDIFFGIYSAEESYLDDELVGCEVKGVSGTENEFFCEVDFLVTKSEDYYVCIYTDADEEEIYSTIRGYPTSNGGCGFFDRGTGNIEEFAFDIFAIGKKFNSSKSIDIRNELSNGEYLSEMFEDYIGELTGYTDDCSPSAPCVVPLRLISGADQDITINNIRVKYTGKGGDTYLNRVFDVGTSSAIITTDNFTMISLDYSNFSVPGSHGGIQYSIEFKGTQIFSEDIIIQAVPEITSLSPMTTASKFPTRFRVFVNKVGNDSIESYGWDINGEVFTTIKNEIIYQFDTIGNYPVEVTVTDIMGRESSRTFNVNVESFISILRKNINESQSNLENIKNQIEAMPQFEQDSLSEVINLDSLNTQLKEVQRLYGQSAYEEAVEKLLNLDIPENIVEGISTSLVSFYPNTDNINIDVIKSSHGGSFESSQENNYIKAVINWHTSNLDTKVKYSQIRADYSYGREEVILNIVDFRAKQLITQNFSSYIFIEELENLRYQSDYGNKSVDGYSEISFDIQDKTIKFSTTEELSFLDLPIFISPALTNLVLVGEIDGEEERGIRWALLILFMFLLLIVGFIVYIVLQHWYKNKYENYLFKNRNYLFNLITYIQNSKKKGEKDSEMIKKLKKAGWNSEQITYVMRKYIGKRTGMWEIPIDKLFRLFGKKSPVPTRPGVGPPRFTPSPKAIPARRIVPPMRRPPIKRPVVRRPLMRRPIPKTGIRSPKKGFPKK